MGREQETVSPCFVQFAAGNLDTVAGVVDRLQNISAVSSKIR
jgi:hypothetical protein